MGWVVNPTPRPFYPRERDPVPIVQETGVPHGRSGGVWKISPPSEFDPRAVQLSYSWTWPPRREVQLHVFLNLEPDVIERSSSVSAAIPLGTNPVNRLPKGLDGPERWFARCGEGHKKQYCDCSFVQIVS